MGVWLDTAFLKTSQKKKNKICWLKMHKKKMGFGELVLGVLMAVL